MKKYTKYRSKQQIFNKVWKHFVVENNPKSMSNASCLYYSKSGGCAIGCLIGDNKDKKKLDKSFDTGIDGIRDAYPDIISKYISTSILSSFLVQLQTIHDCYFTEFEGRMRALAKKYNLKVPKAAKAK
jgi:hypothetical protein